MPAECKHRQFRQRPTAEHEMVRQHIQHKYRVMYCTLCDYWRWVPRDNKDGVVRWS